MSKYRMNLLVCGGTGCKASASENIVENLKKELENNGLENEVQVVTTGCFGFCEKGPVVKVMPDNTFYTRVTPQDAQEIVKEHIIKGRKVRHLLYVDPQSR
ncbi:MAG: (2Fe-2S) ferredoxin domain-containing protein, partial [Bacteroidota bacterium]|nr:(2Fe-2S) ferredoxin domain-containing protein [Bacteroidota bacterium]